MFSVDVLMIHCTTEYNACAYASYDILGTVIKGVALMTDRITPHV